MSFPFFFYPVPDHPSLYQPNPSLVVQTPALRELQPLQDVILMGPYFRNQGFFDPRRKHYVELDIFQKCPETQEYHRYPSSHEVWAQINRLIPPNTRYVKLHYGLDGNVQYLENLANFDYLIE